MIPLDQPTLGGGYAEAGEKLSVKEVKGLKKRKIEQSAASGVFNGEDVRVREAKCPKGGETQLVQKYASIICEGGVVGSTVQVEVCFYFVGPPMDTVYESKSEGFWGCCESWERGGTPERQEREQEVLEIRRVLKGDGPFPALEFVVMQWAQRAGEKGGGAEKL